MNSKMQVPTTAQEYYLELYIRKHKNTLVGVACREDIIRDGINSWKSLEPLDREIIIHKFNEAYTAYQNKFASYLQQSTTARITYENRNGCNTTSRVNTTDIDISINSNENCYNPINSSLVNDENDNYNNDEDIHNAEGYHTLQENHLPPLIIPQPPESPKILRPKDLYEKINSMNENATPYTALNRDDKRFYQNALLNVKRNYLKRYESYLLSLPNELLYRHMNNVVSEETYE